MIENLYTIGVYGSTEATFFDALVNANIDLFVDIRVRRGLRGHTYAYANSAYLQDKLKSLNIDYLHYLPLAPTVAVKQVQEDMDKQAKTARRQRETLSPVFIETYTSEILSRFELDDFLKAAAGHKNICMFCVEQHPQACHRSIAGARLSERLNIPLNHLLP
jgi:uncharacterized protein (DUF488 family)